MPPKMNHCFLLPTDKKLNKLQRIDIKRITNKFKKINLLINTIIYMFIRH